MNYFILSNISRLEYLKCQLTEELFYKVRESNTPLFWFKGYDHDY